MSVARRFKFRSITLWCARHLLPATVLLFIALAIFMVGVPERKPVPRVAAPPAVLPAAKKASAAAVVAVRSELPVIVIDPGHGGADDGATSNGLREKDLTLDIGKRLMAQLQSLGYPVVMTRSEDVYVSLADRVAVANACPGSLLVSIHFNQSWDRSVRGVETFYASDKPPVTSSWLWARIISSLFPKPTDEAGRKLAGCVQQALTLRLMESNRGIRPRDLYVVRHTRQPAILVEAAFISHPSLASQLRTDEYRERIARSLAEGIADYNKPQKAETIQMVRK